MQGGVVEGQGGCRLEGTDVGTAGMKGMVVMSSRLLKGQFSF